MPSIAAVRPGREHRDGNSFLSRHCHDAAYAAVVLAGAYEECGNRGRFRVGAGDVLLHNAFDAHLDRFAPQGATILNLALPEIPVAFAAGRVSDADAIARIAECDSLAAVHILFTQIRGMSPATDDWPDVLAREIASDQNCRLDQWSQAHGIVPETVSRGFNDVFGTTAAGFRAEERARRAFKKIVGSRTPLADIAVLTGFSDQAHMTRGIRALTGAPPTSWRSKSI
jgi:AraC-like DNA-binding protein